MNEIVLQRHDLFATTDRSRGRVGGLMVPLRAALERIAGRWAAYSEFRRELDLATSLNDRLLADMGLTRDDIRASRRAGRWLRAADKF